MSGNQDGAGDQGTSVTANFSTPGVSNVFSSIQKLKGGNYLPWKRQILILLKLRGLEKALKEEAPETIDMQAVLILLEAMDDSHRLQVQSEPTAKAILDNLDRQYANRSLATKHRLLSDFVKSTKLSSDTLNEHVGKLKELRAALADLNETYSEDFFQVILINSLGPEYGSMIEQWEVIHPSMKTTEFLLSILKQKEESLKSETSSFLVQQKKKWSEMTVEEKKKHSNCKKCGQKGHWARECITEAKDSKPTVEEPKYRTNILFNIGKIKAYLRDKWVLDSGATHHMCNNRRWFADLKLFDKPKQARVGNGEPIDILGCGSVNILSKVDGQIVTGTLTNVSYIPSLATNLVSVAVSSKLGIKTVFNDKVCTMSKDGTQVVSGSLVDNDLYVLDIEVVKQKLPDDSQQALIMKDKRSAAEWHRVLGHPGVDRMNSLFNNNDEIKVEGGLGQCAECLAAKAKHVSHPEREYDDCNEVGDRVFVDLGFIANKESATYNYYLLCKDQHSKFIFIYCLESKAEVNTALSKLIADFEFGSGRVIRCIASDNGSEFLNKANKLLFAREHIVHETSSPYIAQQNGQIEREMQTVQNMARTLLCQNNTTPTVLLIKEALKTACFLKNRVPTSSATATPFELFTGRKPNLSHLVEFGLKVQILDNAQRTPKFEPKTLNGVIVGFTNRRNTYRVFVPKVNRVIETCDVYFGPHLETQSEKGYLDRADTATIGTEVLRLDEQPTHRSTAEANVQCSASTGPDEQMTTSKDSTLQDQVDEQEFGLDSLFSEETHPKPGECIAANYPQADESVTDEAAENGSPPLPPRNSSTMSHVSTPQRPILRSRPRRTNGLPYCTGSALDNFFKEQLRLESGGQTDGDTTPVGANLDREKSCEPTPPPLPPRNHLIYLAAQPHQTNLDEPKSFDEALSGPNAPQWQEAIDNELRAHEQNQTWEVVDRPKNGTTLSAKWVFSIKRQADGTIERFKARLVARGFQQREGTDYGEIYAPVAPLDAIRTLIALAAVYDMSMVQIDVTTAFLNGKIDEELFLEPPRGVRVRASQCLKLLKALYGLKQAPRNWYCLFKEFLHTLGLEQTGTDPCIFVDKSKSLIVVIYVDDVLIFGKTQADCDALVNKLAEKFKIKRLSGEMFVGIQIQRRKDSILLSQRRYVEDILIRFNMTDAKGAKSPIIDAKHLVEWESSKKVNNHYRELIGCLMYLANGTRPDILFAVNLLSRYNHDPRECHWRAAKHILRYLIHTKEYVICYHKGCEQLNAFCDSDWASPLADRFSTSGILVKLGDGPIIFSSRKQTGIALSSTEAEYVAACGAAKDIAWLTNLLAELRVELPKVTLHIDNQSTIAQIKNIDSSKRSRHIELRHHYVREQYNKGLFKLEYIPTDHQCADVLTKPISGPKLRQVLINNKVMMQPKALLMMMAILCMCANTGRSIDIMKKFTPADPMIFLETDHKVFTGLQFSTIHLISKSPCESLFDESGPIPHELDELTRATLQERCRRSYNQLVTPEFNNLHKCLPQADKIRHKRFEPITMTIAASALTLCAVSTVVQAAYCQWSPDSSYNRLNSMDEKNAERDRQIEEFKRNLQSAKEIRGEMLTLIGINANKTEYNRQGIIHIATSYPETSWNIAELSLKITDHASNLRDLRYSCKKRKFNFKAMAKIISSNESFAHMSEEYSHLSDITWNGRDLISFYFSVPREAPDTAIYEIATVPYYENSTTVPVAMRYHGPRYMIYNSTSNCIHGLRDIPTKNSIYGKCDEQDYTDPSLVDWRPEDDKGKPLPPMVQRSPTESLVQCMYHNITINGKQRLCPPWPLTLDASVAFEVPGFTYDVYHSEMRVNEANHKFPRLKILKIDTSDYDREIKLHNQVKETNDNSLRPREFNLDKGTLTIPVNTTTLCAAAGVIMISITIYSLVLKSCKGQSRGPTEVNLSVTQTEAAAPVREPPSFYPGIHLYDEVMNHQPENVKYITIAQPSSPVVRGTYGNYIRA